MNAATPMHGPFLPAHPCLFVRLVRLFMLLCLSRHSIHPTRSTTSCLSLPQPLSLARLRWPSILVAFDSADFFPSCVEPLSTLRTRPVLHSFLPGPPLDLRLRRPAPSTSTVAGSFALFAPDAHLDGRTTDADAARAPGFG
ncbi:hypothetical protein MSAN_01722700 [Mycena sanguinolenta]|uniref:Secreted protein n=1 Tax=Mycena sanguinolenta TaxID=230812 RepID=A0A8H7CVB0_9AGAR|nr:hypothetical protein MSAN_01722700 [Mycena sanguinolenta]